MKREDVSTCSLCGGTGFIWQEPNERYPYGSSLVCGCVEQRRQRRRLAKLMRINGLTPEALEAWSFRSFHAEECLTDAAGRQHMAEIAAACERYAQAPRGWMVLSGPYGSGKSHLAYATAAAFLGAGHAAYISTVPDLLEALRRGLNREADASYEQRYDALCRAELLVLDDLGAQNDSAWATEKLYQIIDYRYRSRLPLMVTTNINPFAPGGRLDPRIISRLLDGANVSGGFTQVHLLTSGHYRQRTALRGR